VKTNGLVHQIKKKTSTIKNFKSTRHEFETGRLTYVTLVICLTLSLLLIVSHRLV